MQIENVKEIAGVGWDETAGWDESDESHRLDLVGGTRTARPTQQLNRRDLLCAVVASAAAATFPADARLAGAEEAGAVSLQAFEKAKVQEFAWGWIRWLMNAQIDPKAEMTLGVVYVQPNQSNPLHVHPNSAEYLHMLSGSCEHRVGGRWVSLKTGDTLRIPRGVAHMARTKDEAFRALVVYDTGTRQMVPVTEDKPPRS